MQSGIISTHPQLHPKKLHPHLFHGISFKGQQQDCNGMICSEIITTRTKIEKTQYRGLNILKIKTIFLWYWLNVNYQYLSREVLTDFNIYKPKFIQVQKNVSELCIIVQPCNYT